jgi:hypothetical protein
MSQFTETALSGLSMPSNGSSPPDRVPPAEAEAFFNGCFASFQADAFLAEAKSDDPSLGLEDFKSIASDDSEIDSSSDDSIEEKAKRCGLHKMLLETMLPAEEVKEDSPKEDGKWGSSVELSALLEDSRKRSPESACKQSPRGTKRKRSGGPRSKVRRRECPRRSDAVSVA